MNDAYVARLLIGAARDISRAEKKIMLLHLIKVHIFWEGNKIL